MLPHRREQAQEGVAPRDMLAVVPNPRLIRTPLRAQPAQTVTSQDSRACASVTRVSGIFTVLTRLGLSKTEREEMVTQSFRTCICLRLLALP